VALAEVAAINPRLPTRPPENTAISFLGMADVDETRGGTTAGISKSFGEAANGHTLFLKEDLLVAKITPCFENGKIAAPRIATAVGVGSTEFHVVRPNETHVDRRFLLHFLRTGSVRALGELRMTGSAGQRRVPQAFLTSLRVPLPGLREQRRIARVLDAADALRAKRREATDELRALTEGIFRTAFVSARGSSWPSVPVEDLAVQERGSIRTGPFGSQLLHSEFVPEGVAVLGIDNVVSNEFRWGRPRYITQRKYTELERYTVRPGDVLITIMGTCGRVAVVPDDIPTAINTKHLCCVTVDPTRCLPRFLHAYFLLHPAARHYLRDAAKGAIMSGLNMGTIKRLPVLLPPVEAQQRYVSSVQKLDRQLEGAQAHLARLDALFASLQHRAFASEL
jgi:type I restriction enzyme S subunit